MVKFWGTFYFFWGGGERGIFSYLKTPVYIFFNFMHILFKMKWSYMYMCKNMTNDITMKLVNLLHFVQKR